MPLRQVARTPRRELPHRPHGIPFAFTSEVRQHPTPGLSTHVVRCPWCGQDEILTEGVMLGECQVTGRRYVVVVPAGTPVLA